MKAFLKLMLLLLALVFLQIFVINNMNLGGSINPYIYPIFILILPFETAGWLLLLTSFMLGLTIDSFMGTLGMHASALVLMAFVRHYLLDYFDIRGDVAQKGYLNAANLGFSWTFRYVLLLILVHHFVLFFLESFTFIGFFHTLWRVILSALVSTFYIIIGQYLFARN